MSSVAGSSVGLEVGKETSEAGGQIRRGGGLHGQCVVRDSQVRSKRVKQGNQRSSILMPVLPD